MNEWITSLVGAESAQTVSYGLIGLAGLIGLLILYWLFKKLTHGTFISGGRNAQPRLAVQDATPVDSHRRLVLVRRDDVEHLLLIGGNTDIVVEQNIRLGTPAQRQAPEPAMRERPIAESRPMQPPLRRAEPMPPPARPAPPPAPRAEMRPEARPETRIEPVAPVPIARSEPPFGQPAPGRFEQRPTPDAPERPLYANLSQSAERPNVQPIEPNLDDELEKMMGELDVFGQPRQKS